MKHLRPTPTESSRSTRPLRPLANLIKVPLFIILALLVLLAVSEMPSIANLLAGLKPGNPRIGIIAGHWQYDTGAICPDGLQEVELNLQIARRVAQILRNQGYSVETLPEYSAKLDGYQADVFLSIHCDSCIDDLSGFKIARMTHSTVPEMEDLLVNSLYEAYETATGLPRHENTITEDMRQYHALRRIAPETPGAIIECGFMGGDRHLLENEQDRVAVGIANGIEAFLRAGSNSEDTITRTP